MPAGSRDPVDNWRGAARLAVEATRGATDLVQVMHRTIAGGAPVVGGLIEPVVAMFSAPAYATIRGVTACVGAALDAALAQLADLPRDGAPAPEREAVQAVLNGVLGDYLSETGNPLALEMALLDDRRRMAAAIPDARRVLVLVHGSSMAPHQWTRHGHDHGEALARDLGYTVAYLRYNSGLHISTNGRAFAELLEERLATAEEIVVLGHSMGGLVARSACRQAEIAGHVWRSKLKALVCLGSPHHGAPLERVGSWVHALLGVSSYSAPLGRLARLRSAGVTDMRFGNVLDEHWRDCDRFEVGGDARTPLALPAGVACYAIAATRSPGPDLRLRGDGVVPVASALGEHPQPALALDFRRTWVGFGMDHFDLLDHPRVYEAIHRWLASDLG